MHSIWQSLRSIAIMLATSLPISLSLPYNPTAAYLSSNGSAIYLLDASADDLSFQLLYLNTSDSISSNLSAARSLGPLPFDLSEETALASAIDAQDNIYILSGECQDGASGSQLWTYAPSSGQWKKATLDTASIQDPGSNAGVNFLASAMVFPSSSPGASDLYFFGGMCPNSSSLNVDNWQSAATYSNALLSFKSAASGTGQVSFGLSSLAVRGPPIPESGFSMTPLEPAYLNSTSNSNVNQRNFVAVGGQTSTAFINMSQVALFSLPEQSWSFLPIDTSSVDIASIDPRSGHAAAITEDGENIFVIGGWVGDVDTLANPQLMVLRVGSGYGGADTWEWHIPSPQGQGPANGTGLYGHAAVMLPGDVLMITGGYTIASDSSNTRKRAASATNTQTFFFNITSSTWITGYQNNNLPVPASTTPIASSSRPSNAVEIGLSVGLGIVVLALIVAAILYFCRHRVRRFRQNRDRHLVRQSMNAANGSQASVMTERQQWEDQRGDGARHGQVWGSRPSSSNPYPWAPEPAGINASTLSRAAEAERTGLLLDVPSPTRGLRRSLHSRHNNYWPDDGRRSRGSGHIHPIDERDEYEQPEENAEGHDAGAEQDNIVSHSAVPDPFQDPAHHLLDGSRTPSPVRERDPQAPPWQAWNPGESASQYHAERSSPAEKSVRTLSSLSDSNRSLVSALSFQPSLHRSSSQRSTAILDANTRSLNHSPVPSDSPPSPLTPTHRSRPRSLTLGRGEDSPVSASRPTSFPQLQAEGYALLGAAPSPGEAPSTRTPSRARTLLGSFRRVLTGGDRRNSAATEGSSSPTFLARRGAGSTIQRSMSAGALPWQRRQGARDWDYTPGQSSPGTSGFAGDDEDWDVESAIERRCVQVMFTVPRERLRVVNTGPDDGVSVASVEPQVGIIEEVGHELDSVEVEAEEEHGRERRRRDGEVG